jgi:site-specific DNA-methyltransferase (adenine-specific)
MIQNDLLQLAHSITELKLLPGNPRRGDIEAVKRSLEAFGQRKPIVVRRTDNVVIAGNHTLQAAQALGWAEIAVVWVDDDEVTSKAFALADNRTAELGDYDEEALADLINDVGSLNPGLLESSGWDDKAVQELLDRVEQIELPTDVDVVPEDVPAISKLGDTWLLGKHRVMCGDSTSDVEVGSLLCGIKADMAFTDPPYGVAYTGGLQFKDGEVIKNNQKMIMNDDKDIYADVFPILAKYVDGACYIWFAGTKASSLYQAAESLGDIHALIIWVKNGGYGALNANYKQKHEPCLYWKPKNTSLKFVGETTETTIWEIDKDGRNKLHPTQKPVELASKAIKNHSAKTVLDLFGGSGSTLIAAEETNRTAYLMELDPKYVDVICARFQKLTGVLPVLESSGKVHDFLNA